jgi:hypothetical protein
MTAALATMAVRVTVADTWQTLTLDATPDMTVAGLKARALTACHIAPDRTSRYEVKHGGAPVRDESRTLGSLGVRDGSAVIVLAKRRRAVR